MSEKDLCLIKFNQDILAIILAIQSYKDFVIKDYIARKYQEEDFDWYDKVQEYFKSLELPRGIIHNKINLEYILNFPKNRLSRLRKMTEEEMCAEYVWLYVDSDNVDL